MRRGAAGPALSIVGIALGVGVLFASIATDAGIEASIDRTVRDLVGRADLRVSAFGEAGLAPETSPRSSGRRRRRRGAGPGTADLPRPEHRRSERSARARHDLGVDPDRASRASPRPPLVAGAPLVGDEAFAALVTERLARTTAWRSAATSRLQGRRRARSRSGRRDHRGRRAVRRRGRAGPSSCRSGRRSGCFGDGRRQPGRHRRRRGLAGRGRRARSSRPDDGALRPVVAAPTSPPRSALDGRLPVDDGADRRGRAVRRGVPDLQHAVDDGRRARPRARPAACRRRDPRPGDRFVLARPLVLGSPARSPASPSGSVSPP